MPRNLACGLLTAGICFRMSLPIVIGHSPVAVEFDTHIQPGMTLLVNPLGSKKCPKYCLEGVYLDRTAVGLKPRFLAGAPPTDPDIAAVLQQISRRVIRKLRRLGYLETGVDAPVATGYDPLHDTTPELARTMAASVQHRIAFGERAGQHVRRI